MGGKHSGLVTDCIRRGGGARGESDRDAESVCERERRSRGGGSACAVGRWGSEKVGGRKLIITIDSSMDVLESVSLISSVNSMHAKYSTRYIC